MTQQEYSMMQDKCMEYQALDTELNSLRQFMIYLDKTIEQALQSNRDISILPVELVISHEYERPQSLSIPVEGGYQIMQFCQWYENMLEDKMNQL